MACRYLAESFLNKKRKDTDSSMELKLTYPLSRIQAKKKKKTYNNPAL